MVADAPVQFSVGAVVYSSTTEQCSAVQPKSSAVHQCSYWHVVEAVVFGDHKKKKLGKDTGG